MLDDLQCDLAFLKHDDHGVCVSSLGVSFSVIMVSGLLLGLRRLRGVFRLPLASATPPFLFWQLSWPTT